MTIDASARVGEVQRSESASSAGMSIMLPTAHHATCVSATSPRHDRGLQGKATTAVICRMATWPSRVRPFAKRLASPSRGDLRNIEFTERDRTLLAWCPDDEIFTLSRELILD